MTLKKLALVALCMFGYAQAQTQPQPATTSPAIAAKLSVRGDALGIRVSEIRMTRPNDILVVQSDLENTGRTDRMIFFRYKWLDSGGNQLGDGESWKQTTVLGLGQQTLKSVAPAGSAVDFRLEMNINQ